MLKRIRWARWLLLAVAWAALSVSLLAPGFWEPFPFLPIRSPFDVFPPRHTSVFALLIIDLNWFSGVMQPGPLLILLPGAAALVLTPLLVIRRPRSFWSLLWSLVVFCLLLPWGLPLLCQYDAVRSHESPIGWSDFMWGYYLYAAAHTLAFVACLMAPPIARRVSRKFGFPVIPRTEASPPSE